MFKKSHLWLYVLPLLIVIFSIPLLFATPSDFKLNQFYIAQQGITNGSFTLVDTLRAFKSYYSFGWNNLKGGFDATTVSYSDYKQFFAYLWQRFPTYALQYPTETYYYYTAKVANPELGERIISGNIRLLDAGDGLIRMGYFDKVNPHDSIDADWAGSIGPEDGLTINSLNEYTHDVTFNGKTIRFVMSDFVHTPPETLDLLPDEEFVSQIFDESGARLVLLFNNTTDSFYYVVNEDVGLNESVTDIGDGYWLGQNSGYVYYHDAKENRRFLVGVSQASIYGNDYYDGPFDQVPPRLPIREKLTSAYPYVQYRGGIDEHGNFLKVEGSRVAVSPYYEYESTDTLKTYLGRCFPEAGKSQLWSCLTYEWKRDFRP